MINRLYRFRGHNSLSYLFRKGNVERVDFLSLKFARGKNDDYRLSVIVSKKVSKSAVVRNRIRRRIYEIFRVMKKASSVKWPYDMALTVYDERISSMSHNELHELIEKLLKKSKII